jgi:hypothetical protein
MEGKGLDDDAQLAQMGHKSELKRQYSLLYVLIVGSRVGA